jgi:MEDS: MEthanogen/methylotroph, DcmR Sensory domain
MNTAKVPVFDGLTRAPLTQWHDQEQTGHVVQFYSDDAFLLDAVSRFVGQALGAGDAAIVVATGEHRDQLGQRLKAKGLDTLAAVQQGRYIS